MAVGKGSTLVYILIIVFGIVAFGLSIAGERRPSTGTLNTDLSDDTYCVYETDAASGYGIGACLLLLCLQVVLMVVTGCLCCGRPLARGGSRACTIVFFVISWISFSIAEASLIAAARDNSFHDRYGRPTYAKGISCSKLRKVQFQDGAIFAVSTTILNVFYYMCFTQASRKRIDQQSTDRPVNSTIAMTQVDKLGTHLDRAI
ncbi:uncharacterized protein [Henckelia pumila]|uniref:uncharacterized protein n=1 Tax=Henckelia pumila TaxID=405737 RepID=UPI003C6E1DFA